MTYAAVYRQLTGRLTGADIPDSDFEVTCLLRDVGGFTGGLPQKSEEEIPAAFLDKLLAAAEERLGGRPLQYILGKWDFLRLRLAVGEGVLIPRPETELLCELTAAELVKRFPGITPRVLDLCAGSGCVGLGIASLCPAAVTAAELSEEAFPYLLKNCKRYPNYQVKPLKLDVLRDFDQVGETFHCIVSNPPYIPAADLPHLQREVRREPSVALDGGADGLAFYRVIAAAWSKKLLPGGVLAVEVGIGQSEAVAEMFRGAGLEDVTVTEDYSGIPRVVTGIRK